MSLFSELKRRNVIRVGIAYVVASWLVAQVLELVFSTFGTPDWVMKTVLVLMAVGLIFALFFSWAFELTSEGLKREKDIDPAQSIALHTGKNLDRLITVVLVLALAYFAFDKFILQPSRDAELVQSARDAVTEEVVKEQVAVIPATPVQTDQSIAVLPFVNMSDDKDYFADGLSEELLNLLANIPDLKVAGRTSSFAFKGKNEDLSRIGEALRVAYVLEGSVRRSGERLRITAQLIKADDGYHVWSETYDRQMADIFDIQDDVAQAITEALKLHLTPTANRLTDNTEAYALYLQAMALLMDVRPEPMTHGMSLLDRAIELDPSFAKAWELKATYYWIGSGWLWDGPASQQLISDAANRALELDPSLAGARTFAITSAEDWSWITELGAVEELVRVEPANINALGTLIYDLVMVGYFNEAIALADRIIELEPLAMLGYWRKGEALSGLGRRDEAKAEWLKAVQLGSDIALWNLAASELINGNDDLAAEYLRQFWKASGRDYGDAREHIAKIRDPATGKAFLDKWLAAVIANDSSLEERITGLQWYMIFGFLDDYFSEIRKLREKGGDSWSNSDVLENAGMTLRQSGYTSHPIYLEFAEEDGVFELWDQRGAPDHCTKTDGNWVCE